MLRTLHARNLTAAVFALMTAASLLVCSTFAQSRGTQALTASEAKPTPKPFISLSPSVVMLQGEPGESFKRSFQMTNGTPVPLTFRMLALDAVVNDGKRVFLQAGETPGSIAATAVFSVPQITIAPHQAGQVSVTLTAPPKTAIRAVVVEFHGMNPIATPFQTKAMATASLGALVTFTLSGNVQIDASPLEIEGQSPTTNAAVSTWLRNTGTDPVVVEGMAAILNQNKQLSAKAPFPTQRLLPGERLLFKSELPVELEPGQYRVFVTFLCAGKTVTESTNLQVQ
jgi:hypothetical protein